MEETISPIEFGNGVETYVYDYRKVPLGAGELALELLSFKQQAAVRPATAFNDLLRSRSAEFASLCLAFLVRKKLPDGSLSPFDDGKLDEVQSFLKNLEGEDAFQKANEAISDFFLKRGHAATLSNVLTRDLVGENKKRELLKLLTETIGLNKTDSSTSAASESSLSGTKESFPAASKRGKTSRS